MPDAWAYGCRMSRMYICMPENDGWKKLGWPSVRRMAMRAGRDLVRLVYMVAREDECEEKGQRGVGKASRGEWVEVAKSSPISW